ncbi:hypothetical protein PSSHI_38120 [Photobacterium sp. R1]
MMTGTASMITKGATLPEERACLNEDENPPGAAKADSAANAKTKAANMRIGVLFFIVYISLSI